MINSLKALAVTFTTFGRRKVTAEYPKEHLPVDERYMGFPALLWDYQRDEPFCTGCMVCVRYCPTQCMKAEMHDNPKFASGDSHRRKIIEKFEINLNRCILCGICVDVCNFDAIEMSHEHELAGRGRSDRRMDLQGLLAMGRKYQVETGWKPSKPNSPSPKEKQAAQAAAAANVPPSAGTVAADGPVRTSVEVTAPAGIGTSARGAAPDRAAPATTIAAASTEAQPRSGETGEAKEAAAG